MTLIVTLGYTELVKLELSTKYPDGVKIGLEKQNENGVAVDNVDRDC